MPAFSPVASTSISRGPIESPSFVVGVAHPARRASTESSLPCPRPSDTLGASVFDRFAASLAVGVGHSFAEIASGTPAPFPFTPFSRSVACRARHVDGSSPSFDTYASGVGHWRASPGRSSVPSSRFSFPCPLPLVGLDHVRIASVSVVPAWWCPCPSERVAVAFALDAASVVVGVGHCSARTPSDGGCDFAFEPRFSASGAVVGVGHPEPEDPLALVRRADITSFDDKRLHAVTQPRQVFDDAWESKGGVSSHIFAKNKRRRDLTNDASDFWPQVSFVVSSESFSGS